MVLRVTDDAQTTQKAELRLGIGLWAGLGTVHMGKGQFTQWCPTHVAVLCDDRAIASYTKI